ncbi:hypothetical protein EYF80_033773 [Liparis tanakae]|uniref:Uncharacterized protein n=1 Tax=Liparis tanakae TaxID=230148 RepID=A0A4Z2GR63_9TELE|nr:hypothetical protein EYF80_033773 [Liparis tanakae]
MQSSLKHAELRVKVEAAVVLYAIPSKREQKEAWRSDRFQSVEHFHSEGSRTAPRLADEI